VARFSLRLIAKARSGQRIRIELLRERRAEYGEEIVATLSQQLGWSHFVELLPLKKHLQRDFYAEMCRVERWSVRMLRQKISGMLYERTAVAGVPHASRFTLRICFANRLPAF